MGIFVFRNFRVAISVNFILFYFSFNSNFYVSKIMHLRAAILDAACCYLWLFLLYIIDMEIRVGKIVVKF